MLVKEMSVENRPRERMEKYGSSVLSDYELLAIILQKGSRKENVIDMSNRLLKDGLKELSEKSVSELKTYVGIGNAKAMQIKAVFELARRVKVSDKKMINNAKDVYDYMFPKIGHLKQEHFCVILLDSRNGVIKDKIITKGTLNSSLVHPREVFNFAIRNYANSIILVHNHPSGCVEPSSEDIDVTKKFKDCGELLGIKVVDHVVLGDGWKSV